MHAMEMSQPFAQRERFRETYFQSVEDVLRFWTGSMQEEIARHNHGWQSPATDFENYLRASELRYWIAYETLVATGSLRSLCDVGGFFGAFPLTLRRLHVDVAMTETLNYYSDSFRPLFDFLQSQDVDIINHDPFEQEPCIERHFDAVTAMAVLEHYPHSHRRILAFMQSITGSQGRMYIEVPNIAYWPRRWALLRGRSPLVPIEDVYKSAVPFIGHHHEFTMSELHTLVKLAKLEVIRNGYYNYSLSGSWIRRLISEPLQTLMSLRPTMRECLFILVRPSAAANQTKLLKHD